MSYCDNCGFSLPDGSVYCPHCGAPVKKRTEVASAPREPMGRIFQAALSGTFLSIVMSSFSAGLRLYFIPSFLASLIVIFLSKTRRINEAIVIALAVYFFTNTIAVVINYTILYVNNESPLTNPEFREILAEVPTLLDIIMYAADPVTAIVAAYIGVRLTSKTPVKEGQPVGYRREEEPGGVIYSLEGDWEKPLTSSPHKA